MNDHELIYDWNSVEKVAPLSPRRRVQFLDETLRDGIQSPSVVDPSIEDKLRLVELANDLGIDTMDIGLPGAGKRAVEDVTTIAEHIKSQRLEVKASCAARTHLNDVQAVVDISQKVGIEIEVLAFIGSSPIRQYAENWDLPKMLELTATSVALREPRGYWLWAIGLGFAAAAIVLGWFLMLAIVIGATAVVILILHAVM